jgi:hypothetical protein
VDHGFPARHGYAERCLGKTAAQSTSTFGFSSCTFAIRHRRVPGRRCARKLFGPGGNIYFLSELFSTDGKSFQYAAATMTGMTQEQYAAMMFGGGRAPEGWRDIEEQK